MLFLAVAICGVSCGVPCSAVAFGPARQLNGGVASRFSSRGMYGMAASSSFSRSSSSFSRLSTQFSKGGRPKLTKREALTDSRLTPTINHAYIRSHTQQQSQPQPYAHSGAQSPAAAAAAAVAALSVRSVVARASKEEDSDSKPAFQGLTIDPEEVAAAEANSGRNIFSWLLDGSLAALTLYKIGLNIKVLKKPDGTFIPGPEMQRMYNWRDKFLEDLSEERFRPRKKDMDIANRVIDLMTRRPLGDKHQEP
mmetsp:Transcript_1671/g.3023  ORF Transcript_1671/g.3023 Transcript_1671/m.3023 type:complete len:252 (+) Transcript_1671:1568-2323(+)